MANAHAAVLRILARPKTLGVETQLVVYEHEGHHFASPAHQRDEPEPPKPLPGSTRISAVSAFLRRDAIVESITCSKGVHRTYYWSSVGHAAKLFLGNGSVVSKLYGGCDG